MSEERKSDGRSLKVRRRWWAEIVDRLRGRGPRKGKNGAGATVKDNGQGFTVEIDLSGFSRDEIAVSVARDYVMIDAERRREKRGQRRWAAEQARVHLLLPFSETVDQRLAEAEFRNGTLTVHAPLSAEARQRHRQIPIRG